MKRILSSLFIIAALAMAANAQNYDPRRTINVTGDAEVKVVPDEVVINMAVETNNTDLDKAREENDKKVSSILAMVKKLGVEDKFIQTDYLSVEPRYDYTVQYNNERERKFLGYYMTKNISVTLRDVSKFEKLIADALKLGTNFVRGMNFQTTELRKHRDQARLMAIRAAKEKATALATELGQKIGKPITISESSYNVPMYKNVRTMQNASFSDESAGSSGEVIALGQIEIKASVSVTFELE
ncbi:MAG TPA: SIMPL domain-containing protein [Candidatus Kapabacteria bacterium]